jgi:hypothetical protein
MTGADNVPEPVPCAVTMKARRDSGSDQMASTIGEATRLG